MATYLSIAGQTADTYTNTTAYTATPNSIVVFSEWDNTLNTYRAGTAVIDTPNVAAIPGNTFSTPANGEFTCNNLIQTNGGAENMRTNGPAVAAPFTPYHCIYAVDVDQFASAGFEMSDFFDATGRPASFNSTPQSFPGNMNPDTDIYTILLSSGPRQGQPTQNAMGTRVIYEAPVGDLAPSLLKVQPPENEGRPRGTYGNIQSTMSDEEAAAVWLSFGYGLFKGDGESAQEAFWTR